MERPTKGENLHKEDVRQPDIIEIGPIHCTILAPAGLLIPLLLGGQLDRLKLLVPLVVRLSPGVILVGLAQDQLTVGTSKRPSPPATGRGNQSERHLSIS